MTKKKRILRLEKKISSLENELNQFKNALISGAKTSKTSLSCEEVIYEWINGKTAAPKE